MVASANVSASTNRLVFETKTQKVDLRHIPQKNTNQRSITTNTLKLAGSSESSIDCNSSTKCHTPLFGDNYAVSKSSASEMEDTIYAKCRTYNGTDGALIDSKASTENNSSYASAKAMNKTAYFGDDWALGNHKYTKAGYQEVIVETKDTFQ